MSCDVGPGLGSVPAWLWLWCRPTAAAQIRPLAWELPYAVGVALKSKKKGKKYYFPLIFSLSLLGYMRGFTKFISNTCAGFHFFNFTHRGPKIRLSDDTDIFIYFCSQLLRFFQKFPQDDRFFSSFILIK